MKTTKIFLKTLFLRDVIYIFFFLFIIPSFVGKIVDILITKNCFECGIINFWANGIILSGLILWACWIIYNVLLILLKDVHKSYFVEENRENNILKEGQDI
jgi:hypothetical protein